MAIRLHVHPAEPLRPINPQYGKEYVQCRTCCLQSMYELREEITTYHPTRPETYPELVGFYCGNHLHTELKGYNDGSAVEVTYHRAYASDCS